MTSELRIRVWETNEKSDDGRSLFRVGVYKDDVSYQTLGLTIPEELFLGIVLEWREGYERWFTVPEFMEYMEDHSQIARVKKWIKQALKVYKK